MASDPVASKSSFLCSYMNSHVDALVAFVAAHTDERRPQDCMMTEIASTHFCITYRPSDSRQKLEVARIPFDPPLAGYEEVRPRLVAMKADAEEQVGMIKNPTIDTFSMSPQCLITASLLALLCYASLPPDSKLVREEWLGGAALIRSFTGGWFTVKFSWGITLFLHTLEAVMQFALTRKHSTPVGTALCWIAATFLFGVPSLFRFRKLVKQTKIRSVKKTT